MSQDSFLGGSQESQILSQETYQYLQNFVDENLPGNQDFTGQFQVTPYQVTLAEENAQENLQINIERYATRTTPQDYLPSNLFTSSPPTSASYSQPFCNGNLEHPKHQCVTDRHAAITPPPEQPPLQAIVPPNTDFPGGYHFDISFLEEVAPPAKSAPWTYSQQLQKLFIKMRCLVPIRFHFRGGVLPPQGSYVRAMVVYSQPEHYREVVERCLNHITKQKDGHKAPKHLLRCENTHTVYTTCQQTGRHMLMFPVRQPIAGGDYFSEMFQLMCFNSCPGGLNRRPIIVIFTLEHGNRVIGRKVLNTRACACPGRDRGDQELVDSKKKEASNATDQPSTPTPPPTPRAAKPLSPSEEPAVTFKTERPDEPSAHSLQPKTSGKRDCRMVEESLELQSLVAKRIKREDDEVFTIQVVGREKYELLLRIKESLDMWGLLPQTQIDQYRESCPPCGPVWFLEQQKKQQQQQQTLRDSSSSDSEAENTPPSTFPLSQLSRTSSNASQGSSRGTGNEISAVRFSLKRTVSLNKKGLTGQPRNTENLEHAASL